MSCISDRRPSGAGAAGSHSEGQGGRGKELFSCFLFHKTGMLSAWLRPGCFGDQRVPGTGFIPDCRRGVVRSCCIASASPGAWGSAVRAFSPAGDRWGPGPAEGWFSGLLVHFGSCSASDKELSVSPSSPPLPHLRVILPSPHV